MSIPFIAFGNDELEKMPDLGKEAVCPHCGKKHKVEYGKKVLGDGTKVEDKTLAYVQCGDEVYLVGVNGKDITSRLNFEGVTKRRGNNDLGDK